MKQVLILTMLAISLAATAQKNKNTGDSVVAKMLDEQNFIFRAEQMLPQGGRQRILTETTYILKVEANKVTADLPYAGRAFTASPGSTDGGIRFTSEKFSYVKTPRKKGGWDITINPKDINDVRECQLTVFENGTASLMVSSNNRSVISYQGRILIPE
jgi:hypothetical protein